MHNSKSNFIVLILLMLIATPALADTWIEQLLPGTQGIGAYAYLIRGGMTTTLTTKGELAIVGASRTNDNPLAGPYPCCSIGIAGTAINDNTIHPQTAWPLYATVARLPKTGAVQVEMDAANVSDEIADINPYSMFTNGPPGTTVTLALSSGGEPPQVGNTPNGVTSAILGISNNGSFTRHGIVFGGGMFDPSYCLTNCPAIDMPYGYEIRWSKDATDNYGSFIRGNNLSSGNGLVFTSFGVQFENSQGGITAAIASAPTLGNSAYVILSNTYGDALIGPGGANGAVDANLRLQGLGTGAIVINNMPTNCKGHITGTLWNNAGMVGIC